MLATLRIQNLALAEDLTIGFQPGLTAITGETGAGKSILIDALQLALGERADRGMIRAGADSCAVEAVFDLPGGGLKFASIQSMLSSQGIASLDGELFLKRAFSAAGTNRQFINGSPVPLQALARLGEMLVDLHGPHDHQSLLHSARQRDILDAFGDLGGLRGDFGALCARFRDLQSQRRELQGDGRALEGQAELLRFQAGEIQAARLLPDEEAELGAAHTRAANAAQMVQVSQQALALLAEDDQAVLIQSAQLTRFLQELRRLDPGAAPLLALQEQASTLLRDLQIGLRQCAEKIDLNPERLREIEERVGLIQALKRKYGRSIPEILAFAQDAALKLGRIEGRAETLAALDREMAALQDQLWQTGRELSRRRRNLVPRLAKVTLAELNDLGFKDSRFEADLSSVENSADAIWSDMDGLDTVEFLFSPNVGEPLRPLRAIASSGEMARVMLALKTALADQDQVPVLVFDEVDANVGGETAVKVGEKMRQIARKRQVLCITHLAPVAAAAQNHLVVSKQVRDNRTLTEVASLGPAGRVDEIARMLGGRSRAALDHAQTLLERR